MDKVILVKDGENGSGQTVVESPAGQLALFDFREGLVPEAREVFDALSSEQQSGYVRFLPPKLVSDILLSRSNLEAEARTVASGIQEIIAPNGQLPPEQRSLPNCHMPTNLCRTSPFYPLAKKDMADRRFLKDEPISESDWGKITYTGEQLSVYDEDILMALLAIIAEQKSVMNIGGITTYSYKGPLLPILKATGVSGNPGKDHYARAKNSLERMVGAKVALYVKTKTTRGKPVETKRFSDVILMHFDGYDKGGDDQVLVIVNPFFYETYHGREGGYTILDMAVRSKLRSQIAKAVYRFLRSQDKASWFGMVLFDNLARAINLNLDDRYEAKKNLKKAIEELKKIGYLDKKCGLDGDMVSVYESGTEQKTFLARKIQRRKRRKV